MGGGDVVLDKVIWIDQLECGILICSFAFNPNLLFGLNGQIAKYIYFLFSRKIFCGKRLES